MGYVCTFSCSNPAHLLGQNGILRLFSRTWTLQWTPRIYHQESLWKVPAYLAFRNRGPLLGMMNAEEGTKHEVLAKSIFLFIIKLIYTTKKYFCKHRGIAKILFR